MSNFIFIFATLLSSFMAYWFCGHCIAVALNGGPRGDGSEFYQRATHPIRFILYVAVTGIIGLVLVSHTIYMLIKAWRTLFTS